MGTIARKDKPQIVLIIDGDKSVVQILRGYLKDEGFRTAEAYDGIRGVLHALHDRPDLVIMELNLPRLSGYEVIKRLQSVSKSTAEIPLVILSSKNISDQEKRTLVDLEPNVKEYITKPVTHGSFMVRIHKLLGTGVNEKDVFEKLRHLTNGEKSIGD